MLRGVKLASEPGRSTRSALWRGVRLSTVCALLGLAVTSLSPGSGLVPSAIDVSVDFARPVAAVPQDFLGLSFELRDVRRMAMLNKIGYLGSFLGSLGPGVLRLGGVTADTRTWWPDRQVVPRWVRLALSAADFGGVDRLVRRAGWDVLLTLNFAHYAPNRAASEVAVAQAALGRRLTGFALGNEPDGYGYLSEHLRSYPWGFQTYHHQAGAYLTAIRAVSPRVALVGPETATPNDVAWITGEASKLHPRLLTAHYYPLNCARRPRFGALLTDRMHSEEDATLRKFAKAAALTRIPLRIDETNNVSCGGLPHVSNTFASALWAVDYITRAMTTPGIVGVNFHDTLSCNGYSPLCATLDRTRGRVAVHANPEWYALLLTHQLVSERPLPANLGEPPAGVAIRAFLNRDGRLHLVVTDERATTAQDVTVRVHVPSRFASATVLRLTGPSPRATDGVRLGGRMVGARGTWSPLPLARISAQHGVISMRIAAGSAALATLYPIGPRRPPGRRIARWRASRR